ncbi:hypothetical protein ARMSODRAFT_995135 [Armillaria solidipes]|uniref:SSD domain-containing protein n=1 Tax=Armillaria solidipes TaxID=1076256 RepID=A0A2H3BH78_9AGAR|nr:hypothetical protein ARMSODRAFT_995135 [Armillaria solidipes]
MLVAAGLFVLANLPTVAARTAVVDTASCLDIFLLAPGMHYQQALPTTGAITTGYLFCVENPATRTGHLVTAPVLLHLPPPVVLCCRCPRDARLHRRARAHRRCGSAAGCLTGFGGSRSFGVVHVIEAHKCGHHQAEKLESWKGLPEPGTNGDLLILLSRDRWIRLHGSTTTAGQWLRDRSIVEGFTISFSTLLVYAAVIVTFNASTVGILMIACLLLCSSALLSFCNSLMPMFNCIVQVDGESKEYKQRLQKSARSDWAIRLGLIVPKILRLQLLFDM